MSSMANAKWHAKISTRISINLNHKHAFENRVVSTGIQEQVER